MKQLNLAYQDSLDGPSYLFLRLHTNDAAGGVTRLLDMGVEPFFDNILCKRFLSHKGFLRVICPDCKEEDTSIGDEIKKQIIQEIAEFLPFYRKNPEQYKKFAQLKESDIHFLQRQRFARHATLMVLETGQLYMKSLLLTRL